MDTVIRINVYRLLLTIFFLFLLFSNLISRIIGHSLNLFFYAWWLLVFYYSIKDIRLNTITLTWAIVGLFLIAYIADPAYILLANVLTIKDFIIPILSFYIGYVLSKSPQNKVVFNDINILYFITIFYAIVQEISFYSGKLGEVLPWDAEYLSSILKGPNNFLQPGGLLRFFGTMNSFVEFQIVSLFLGTFLWLNREKIKTKKLLKLNMILMVIFLSLALERSPIVMGVVLLLVWNIKNLVINYKVLLRYVFVSSVVIILLLVNIDFLKSNHLTTGAYQRLYNAITLNLRNDQAIQERVNEPWKQALKLARENYFGIGPGRLSPSAKNIYPKGYIGPHNNFLAVYLAYGLVGLLLFLILLLLGMWRLSYIKDDYRFFGYGMILAYASMAMFNMPYIGKQGICFFLIFGFLCGQKLDRRLQRNRNTGKHFPDRKKELLTQISNNYNQCGC